MWIEDNPHEVINFEKSQHINCISHSPPSLTTTLKAVENVTIPGQTETII